MSGIERAGQYYAVDWTVARVMEGLIVELQPYLARKDAPYCRALLSLAARRSDEFRRNGYSFHGCTFSGWRRDRRGKLVSCDASFPQNFSWSGGTIEKSANGIPSGERSPSGKPCPRAGGCNTGDCANSASGRKGTPNSDCRPPASPARGGNRAIF